MTTLDKLRAAHKPRHRMPVAFSLGAFLWLVFALGTGSEQARTLFAVLAVIWAVLAFAGILAGRYQEARRRHASH